jgi:hypothetical protein
LYKVFVRLATHLGSTKIISPNVGAAFLATSRTSTEGQKKSGKTEADSNLST